MRILTLSHLQPTSSPMENLGQMEASSDTETTTHIIEPFHIELAGSADFLKDIKERKETYSSLADSAEWAD